MTIGYDSFRATMTKSSRVDSESSLSIENFIRSMGLSPVLFWPPVCDEASLGLNRLDAVADDLETWDNFVRKQFD